MFKTGYLFSANNAEKWERSRTACYLEFFVLFSSTTRAILQNGNLCVWVCQHEGNLSRHASIMWTRLVRTQRSNLIFPGFWNIPHIIERAWCITIARVKLCLCISGVPERADITVRNVERKFLRINHITMENACKIITLISYEMFRRLYCRCSRRALMQIANGIFNKRCLELHVVLWI